MNMKHLLSIDDLKKSEIEKIFTLTDKLKNKKISALKNKNLAMIFEKPSTRTRISFEVAMNDLGAHAIFLNKNDMQLSRGESIKDTARVLSGYADAIMARVYDHKTLIELRKHSSVPVINGLSDIAHPCQALADAYTIKKHKGLKGRIVFLGDGRNNTFHSLSKLCEMFGMDIVFSCPAKYRPKEKYKIIEDPRQGAVGADILYTDTFVSMGEESEKAVREKELKKYQLNPALIRRAGSPIVMHPLPAHRGMEISDSAMDGKNSVIFEQAENRLHVQKAILALLMK